MVDVGIIVEAPAPKEGVLTAVKAHVEYQDGTKSIEGRDIAKGGDFTAPDSLSIEIAENGYTISGTTEPYAFVDIDINNNGTIDYTLKADKNGSFSKNIYKPLLNGEEISATARDKYGNSTYPVIIKKAPGKPTGITVGNGDDFITKDEIDEQGNVDVIVGLPDDAKAGYTVVVNGKEQELTEEDKTKGEVTVKVPAPEESKTLTVDANIKDPAGNESEILTEDVGQVDTTTPEAPVIEDITNNFDDTGNVESTTITGTAEPGSTVEVKNPTTGDVVGSGTVGEDGKFEIVVEGGLEDGQDYDVTAKDSAGNTSDPTKVTGDTTAPEAPTVTEVTNVDTDGDGQPDGTIIKGSAEPGSTVTVTDPEGNVIGEAIADSETGEYEITTDPAVADGQEVDVTATDDKGNESDPTKVTGDTTAQAPTLALENDTGLSDSDGITKDGTVLVSGLEEGATWQYSTDGGDTWIEGTGNSFDLPEGKYADGKVVVRQTDAAGNTSDNASLGAVTVDTTAPAPLLELADDTGIPGDGITKDGTVNVNGLEEGATWQYSIDGGATWMDGEGDSFILPVGTYTEGEVLAKQTDVSGNISEGSILNGRVSVVENSLLAAVDNTEELVLDIVATKREATESETIAGQKVDSFGVVSAGLGGVADAGVLDFANNAIELNVAEGTERVLELFAGGGGVSIGDTYNLIIYKEDAYGNTKFYDVYDDWFTVPLLGQTKTGEISITEPGKYHIMLSAKAGVKVIGGTRLEVRKDTVMDYNEYESVSGVHQGNVITDLDLSGKDQIDEPDNTRITKITYENDKGTHEVDVPAVGSTVIQLAHGTLTMSAKGNYTYKLNEGANPKFGAQEKVTYTITNSKTGDSSSADLTINLVDKPSNLVPDSTVWLDMKPEAKEIDIPAKDKLSSKTWADILGVGLGIADIGLIAIENGLEIKVGENQVRDVTFWANGGAPVALGYSPVDLVIYKKETTANGDFWQLYTIEENWFGIVGVVVGAGRTSEDKTFRFDEGEYKAVLVPTTGGVNVIPSTTLRIREDKLYEYEQTNAKVETDLGLDEGAVVYSVDGEPLAEGNNIIQGQYGTLTINADGSYSYELYQNIAYKDIGNMETFSYSILGADNKLYNSTLNIVINNVQANDDFGDARFGLDNQEAYGGWEASGTKTGSGNSTYSSNLIEVQANQVYDLTLNYNLNPFGERADEFVIRLIDVVTGKAIKTYTPNVNGEQGELSWSLTEGQYRVEVIIDPRLANTVRYDLSLQGTITTLDQFQAEQANTIVEEGSLLDNDTYKEGSGIAELAHIEVNGKPLDIVVNGQFDNNLYKFITIEGEYGTLVVQQDGSYIYTTHGDSYGVDVFDYKLISIAGSSDSAKLTFNAGMNVTGSKYDDVVISSAADDKFIMGEGADTLVFNNLGGTDEGGNGNNGVDTWADFDATQGDKIDITGLLDGNQTASNIGSYLKYENGVLMVDRNGNSEFEDLLKVNATDIDELLDSIEWQAAVSGKVANYSINTEDTVYLPDTLLATSAEEDDVLSFEGADQMISLADIMQPDVIDINGTGANTLNVAVEDVDSAIYVKGGSDDTVNLEGSNWSTVEQTTLESHF
ncbi:BapA/Bap/LapF family large adhesin [Psychrobacter pasteurii]